MITETLDYLKKNRAAAKHSNEQNLMPDNGLKEDFICETKDYRGINYRVFYRPERGYFVYKKIYDGYQAN